MSDENQDSIRRSHSLRERTLLSDLIGPEPKRKRSVPTEGTPLRFRRRRGVETNGVLVRYESGGVTTGQVCIGNSPMWSAKRFGKALQRRGITVHGYDWVVVHVSEPIVQRIVREW